MRAAGADRSRSAAMRAPVLLPALVILLGAVLRLSLLGADVRFHPDEALFAAQARLISAQGDWLLRSTDLDKPPLTFYIAALSFRLLGPSEFAARLPNVFASILTLAVAYRLGRTLYGDRITASAAVLLLALSPFDLAFAATSFTDIQATLWILAACTLAAHDRWALAGLAATLMIGAKTTALLALPLILALGLARSAPPEWRWGDLQRRLGRFVAPLAAGIALLLLWDAARAPRSFWTLGWARNDPGRLIRADELLPRLDSWLEWLGWYTGSPALMALLAALIVAWLVLQFGQRSCPAAADWLIAGWAIALLGWYWLVAFNTYDRYLHPLIPCLLLLAARAVRGLLRALRLRQGTQAALILALGLAVLPGTARALRGETPVGGDHGQHTGIDRLAAYLAAELPGAVLYDHWLGWELAYYLGANPPLEVRYAAQPEQLSDDLRGARSASYFVAPSPEAAARWIAVLARAAIAAKPVYHDAERGFVVYRLSAR